MTKKIFFLYAPLSILIVILGYLLYIDHTSDNNIKNFFVAANAQNCNTLHPLTDYDAINKDVICPRGDVGNFMVIDKVRYEIVNILDRKLSSKKQVLVKVCIEARGQAAWNEGAYEGCTTDSRLIEFTRSFFGWQANLSQFTDIANLMRESGSKPKDYDKFRSDCFQSHIAAVMAGERGYDCNNVVGSDIEYSIKTHKFVETGKAH